MKFNKNTAVLDRHGPAGAHSLVLGPPDSVSHGGVGKLNAVGLNNYYRRVIDVNLKFQEVLVSQCSQKPLIVVYIFIAGYLPKAPVSFSK